MKGVEYKDETYNDETYNDDRMFVLHLCKCTVDASGAETIATTIYHENAPDESKWCLATYRNTARYPAVRVDDFDSVEAARAYMERVAPTVPLVSLGGQSPVIPLPYDVWLAWKAENRLQDYDYKKMYLPGGANPREVVISRKR